MVLNNSTIVRPSSAAKIRFPSASETPRSKATSSNSCVTAELSPERSPNNPPTVEGISEPGSKSAASFEPVVISRCFSAVSVVWLTNALLSILTGVEVATWTVARIRD